MREEHETWQRASKDEVGFEEEIESLKSFSKLIKICQDLLTSSGLGTLTKSYLL